jgi:hypothetical protein
MYVVSNGVVIEGSKPGGAPGLRRFLGKDGLFDVTDLGLV